MRDCVQELQAKIDEHKAMGRLGLLPGGMTVCGPSCWCWSAQCTIFMYKSVIEANEMLMKEATKILRKREEYSIISVERFRKWWRHE